MKAWRHFKNITYHKYLVMKGFFAVGLYRQGILHDMSKYSPTEFMVGARFYQGDRSPNNAERELYGYSKAWLHHKGRNRHHYEYWIDYSSRGSHTGLLPAPMPVRYVVEMFMDRIAASKVYNKKSYSDSDSLFYYKNGVESIPNLIHEETKQLLEELLNLLAEKGEQFTFDYIRTVVLKKRKLEEKLADSEKLSVIEEIDSDEDDERKKNPLQDNLHECEDFENHPQITDVREVITYEKGKTG